jgi:hypothetical protein
MSSVSDKFDKQDASVKIFRDLESAIMGENSIVWRMVSVCSIQNTPYLENKYNHRIATKLNHGIETGTGILLF